MSTTSIASPPNPLLPNGTFFVVLLIFCVVLFLLWRYVYPPIQKALADRNEMVHKTQEESQRAAERFSEADARYRDALAEARGESARIRDEARSDGQRVIDEMREQTESEVADIRRRGEEQLANQREQAAQDLRSDVGALSETLAGRVLGEDLSGASRSDTVERFLSRHGSSGET